MNQLKQPNTKKYGIACNPLMDVYHIFENDTHQTTTTGQPVMIYTDNLDETLSLLFESYELDDQNQLISFVERPISVSVEYVESEAMSTVADAEEEIEGLKIKPIKHPDKDEWAIIFSQHVFNEKGKNGPKRQALLDKVGQRMAQGKHKDKETAKGLGWT